MNSLKKLLRACAAATVLHSSLVIAADAPASPDSTMAQAAASGTAAGEVRKIDKSAGKITLKHGDIAGMDMPGMTMVFRAKNPAMLDALKVGDKVNFTLEKTGSSMFVTEIEAVK
ncbi:copper-binding protein [Undibacterium sp.]|uniref:copper-binding protein n=1 Tax=Undibacterium sp. TaxID=1914977 RepID=UPI00374D322C